MIERGCTCTRRVEPGVPKLHDSEGLRLARQEGMKAEPPPLSEAETGLRNEKIAVDDFGDKVADASRKVRVKP